MVIEYTNIYHLNALKHLPKFGIFGLKTNHLATLLHLLVYVFPFLATEMPTGGQS
jgi:hypothetical protein